MTFRDLSGFPVELFKGRPITNFIRILLHASIWQTIFFNPPEEKENRCITQQHKKD